MYLAGRQYSLRKSEILVSLAWELKGQIISNL